MPFDPTVPANNAEATSLMFRQQFQALYQDIQARATVVQMVNADNAVLQQTSANTNNVDTLNVSVGSTYDEAVLLEIVNKINEVILAQRRL